MNSMRAQKGQKPPAAGKCCACLFAYVCVHVCVCVINDALSEERAHKRQHNQTF